MKNQPAAPKKKENKVAKKTTGTSYKKNTTKNKSEKEYDTLDPEGDITKTLPQNNGKNDARKPMPSERLKSISREDPEEEAEYEGSDEEED